MDRVYESGAAGAPPGLPASPSTGYPTAGNPQTAVPATKPGPWWYHMITEEIREVITAAGLTPSHTNLTLLRQAIQSMITGAQKAVVVNGAVFEASVATGEVVRWDGTNTRYDEAVADSTANNLAVGIADVTNGKVYLYGECPLFSGLTPGARYYLSAATAGAITTTAPADAVRLGIAKSATVLFVDIDSGAVPDASETVKGIAELATQAEAEAGTMDTVVMTPLKTSQAIPAKLNASGSAPIYACRAWANFNGTGTVAIRAAGNVGSITDNGVGDYTINFTTAMPDINYTVFGCGAGNSASPASSVGVLGKREDVALTTTSARVVAGTVGTSGAITGDIATACVSIFR